MLESDSDLKELLPSECWNHVISYLPRLSRQSLAQLCSFRELIEGKFLIKLLSDELS